MRRAKMGGATGTTGAFTQTLEQGLSSLRETIDQARGENGLSNYCLWEHPVHGYLVYPPSRDAVVMGRMKSEGFRLLGRHWRDGMGRWHEEAGTSAKPGPKAPPMPWANAEHGV